MLFFLAKSINLSEPFFSPDSLLVNIYLISILFSLTSSIPFFNKPKELSPLPVDSQPTDFF